MLRYNNEKKDKINILLNIDNFYGKHTGGVGRILLFCVLACVPFLVYALVLSSAIPFTLFMIVFVPYCIKMALLTIGREKERKIAYKKRKNDQYASAKELIRFADVHDDGLIEYQNGNIAYVIQAYSYSYMDDNQYSKDLEEFLSKIVGTYEVDIYGHVVVGELGTTQEDLEKLRVYEDDDFLHERLEFYKYQDRIVDDTTKLFRLNFVVKSYKSKWNKLKTDVNTYIKSEQAQCFDMIKVCDKDEALAVGSRDLTLHIDLGEMLRTKHNSENYFGSKVLYFGDEVPEEMIEHTITFDDEEGRRIVDDK